MRDLRALPKAELHIHLEGSIRVETLRELADRSGGALPHGLRGNTWRFDGFLDFIQNYTEACALLNRPEDFRRLAEEFCEDLAIAGVRYAEAVFSPANHAARLAGLVRPDRSGAGRSGGGPAGPRRGRPGVPRCRPRPRDGRGRADPRGGAKFAGQGVVALNAAGSERAPVAAFASVFERASDAGLRSVPHAGEWAGPENVWQTLEHYAPDRIGHGVRSIDDPRLLERARGPRDPPGGRSRSPTWRPASTRRSTTIRSRVCATRA